MLTYRRTDELRRAVATVLDRAVPAVGDRWSLNEVLIVDNNPDGMARATIDALGAERGGPLRYVHEGAAGIVAGRNRALDEATGEILVFIDDDEIALDGWPHGLLKVMSDTGAAMVGGPVLFEFVEKPADWVVESGLFARPDHADGE
jgi:glycosyltransferase involved in cell wall biosynthesis